MHQGWFLDYNRCPTRRQGVRSGTSSVCGVAGRKGAETSLLSAQFSWVCKTVLKIKDQLRKKTIKSFNFF
jgi:hypothetical protein